MDEQEWEEQGEPRVSRPVVVAVAIVAIVILGAFVRPSGTGSPEPPEGILEAATATPDPGDPGETPGAVAGDPGAIAPTAPASEGIAPVSAFDPASRWRALSPGPFSGGIRGEATWDGRRLILWPGRGHGGMYAPDVDAWATLPPAPVERVEGWSATWTGTEVLYFGGLDAEGNPTADGVAFNPASGRWRALPPAPIAPRSWHAAVVGQGRLWVYGGRGLGGEPLADGAVYDPATDAWAVLPEGPLDGRIDPVAAWTGAGLLLWGGSDGREESRGGASLVDGALYRPASGWTTLPDAPVALRGGVAATWTGGLGCPGGPACERLLVWGRPAASLSERDGYAYDVATGTWSALPLLLSQTRSDAVGAWTGRWSLVFGGRDQFDRRWRSDGFVYDPVTERWKQLPAVPVDVGADPVVAWTGSELIVWGNGRGARFAIPDDFLGDGS